MPPRKRQRQSQAGSPAPDTHAKSSSPAAADATAADADSDTPILTDPWTDDEEIGLFKGLMRWKPTGIHKNFHLLALHAWLLENNYIHPKVEHTRPKGIWEKLNTLYDLAALDAREDARQLDTLHTTAEDEHDGDGHGDDDADVYSVAANKIENDEFDLSAIGDAFHHMMWKARFAEGQDESDAELPELNFAQEPPVRFTPTFSIEPSDTATPGSRKGKAIATRTRGGRGGNKATTRRSARNTESVQGKDDEGDEGEGDDDSEEEESSEEEDEDEGSDEGETGPRRGRSRAKPAGRGRGRPRGRGR